MNKQKDTRYTGDTLIKRLGICGEQRFHCILRTDRTVYNQTSKEIYLMQKKEYHFLSYFCVGNKLIP